MSGGSRLKEQDPGHQQLGFFCRVARLSFRAATSLQGKESDEVVKAACLAGFLREDPRGGADCQGQEHLDL